VGLSSLQDYAACMLVILLSEAYTLFERDLIERPQLFGQVFRDRVIMGAFLRGVDYARALAARRRLNDEMEAAFARFDALVAPGMMKALWLADIPRHAMFKRAYPTAAWNVTGHPAINVRCGFSDDGLPFGLQIAGRRNGETDLLRIADIYERASRWSEHRPRL
jgi:aspartyl-tRNA(Asn)/glutamyl-tRNA(Gln) amidotransferase subunit A